MFSKTAGFKQIGGFPLGFVTTEWKLFGITFAKFSNVIHY